MSRIKPRTIITIALISLSLFVTTTFAQNTREIFERARMLDESNQNLSEAIKLYGQVVSQANEQRALAARAQYRIGVLYERLGRKAEAQRAYQTVVSHYADQSEVAERARAKLPASAVKNEKGRMKPASGSSPTGTGVTVRQVWAGLNVDYFGAPSADGRFLTITDWTTGDLGIRDLVSGETRRLTNKGSWTQSTEFAMFPLPSPDGRRVAYAWLNKEGSWDLRVIATDGSAPHVLYQSPDVDLPIPRGWTPDGKYIAAALIRKDRTSQAALISLVDGALRVLKTSSPTGAGSVKGGLSPDGRYIVYDERANPEAKQTDIFLLSVETGKETPLVQHPADDLFPVWTPDGKGVLFASDRSGKLGLWLQRVGDGKPQGAPELVKADAGNIYPMGFTPKGAFYYGLDAGARDVYTATLDLQAGKVLQAPAPISQRYVGSNSLPTWSPDGKYLAYVSRRGAFPSQLSNFGSRVLVIRSVETGQERDLPVDLGGITEHLWARDGRSLIAMGQNKQGFGIFRIDAQTGTLTILMQAPGINYRWPVLSADGKTLFYAQNTKPPKGWSIRALDFQAGGESRVSTIAEEEGVNNVQPTVSPDGKTLFYLQNNPHKKTIGIRARNLQSGEEKELFSMPSPPSNTPGIVPGVGGLSPDGQQLAFVVTDPQKDVLKVIPTTGGEARDICQLPKPPGSAIGTWMIWRPDGKTLLLVRRNAANPQDQTGELWQVSAAGGEPQKVGLAIEGLGSLRLHPDGKHVTFAAGANKPEVWVMENFLPKHNAKEQLRSAARGRR